LSRAVLVLYGEAERRKAAEWLSKAPPLTRIEFKGPRRTIPQNDLMWAALTDVADQLAWHGQRLDTEDWKLMFLDGLKRELRIVPNINNNGFVNLGRSSSDLTKDEMSDLIELIRAFGAEHGVVFHEPADPLAHSAETERA
jgi:hypothetical protein